MFINLTNHPSSGWSEAQLAAARQYGDIVDMSFPVVDENGSEADIKHLADDYLAQILKKGNPSDITVHIMGEQSFCYALISKLQKEGIRCVASCTVRNTYVNGAGEKVSTFQFTRFREYVPPRALRWWRKTMNFIGSLSGGLFRKKSFYSWAVLLLVLLCEICIVVFLQTKCLFAEVAIIVSAGLVVALLFMSRIVGLRFSLRSAIVSKLLANAIAPTPLGTLYLLVFVIHIGWMTNAVLGLFTERECNFCIVLFSFAICVIGSLSVIVFFPDGLENKKDYAKFVFVTGISSFRGKVNASDKEPPYERFTLRPLVRILQIVTQHANYEKYRGELLILQTTDFESAVPTPFFEGCQQYAFDNIDAQECEKYGITPDNGLNDKLRLIIKKIAIKEFPMMEKWIKCNLDISFTTHCNYNDFPGCFETLSKEVHLLDDQDHRLIFNTTPGTAVVSTVMTLLSIDADRELYYYSQDNNIPEARVADRLKKANKQGIKLEGLLSQALEKMSTSQ